MLYFKLGYLLSVHIGVNAGFWHLVSIVPNLEKLIFKRQQCCSRLSSPLSRLMSWITIDTKQCVNVAPVFTSRAPGHIWRHCACRDHWIQQNTKYVGNSFLIGAPIDILMLAETFLFHNYMRESLLIGERLGQVCWSWVWCMVHWNRNIFPALEYQ